MAAKSVTLQQFKHLQYQSQILKSYIQKLETNLKVFSGNANEQFLAITRLKLQNVEEKVLSDRLKEQQLTLQNHQLTAQITRLKQERDALYKAISTKEQQAASSSSSSSSSSSLQSDKSQKAPRRSQKDSGDSKERMIVETALHVIKGAIVKVLEIPTARTTMSVHFSDTPYCGSITLGNCAEGKLYKIGDDIKQHIEEKANEIIQQNVECTIHRSLSRKEAEEKFGDEMYDFYPVPDSVQTVNVLEIKGVNINCSNKELCKSTGELIALKVGKTKFNGKKKQLTVYFTVGPDAKA
mmetsp:Transcript_38024/g.60906  ORF Transcript_38024/g.60906 Transcript_38024/m.60906 type:complete len:296 (+) Transcript_38024:60-947(+)|eukprot:CAMPEP_0197040138 /NCGR_PEP_ID=MMETSP1384-20130603/16885_1 /TAXON_ID=29189 /ORGANISM="Ammonia sp." /LENGTH=295 /DNA_ID=CAMNT_0042470843 /DNA_START=24 /DNA_END=911 /DNA_ORIENTATION=+